MKTTTDIKQNPEIQIKNEHIETPQEFSEYARARFEYKHRLRLVLTIVPGIVGFTLSILPLSFWQYLLPHIALFDKFEFYKNTLALFLFSFAFLGLIMFYLQTGFKRDYREKERLLEYEHNLRTLRNAVVHSSLLNLHTDKVFTDFENLNKKIVDNANTGPNPVRDIKPSFAEMAEDQFKTSVQRLNGEITVLGWRGNLNLGLGITTTFIGLWLLREYLSQSVTQNELFSTFAIHFIPRLSLVLFIEVFSYFFLRLYKSTLLEIKYYQNEMTNLELKHIALLTAMEHSDSKALAEVISTMVSSERNHVLKKGETTVQIEQLKNNSEMITNVGKVVADAVVMALKNK